jgi:sigma-B regulation protein RsbU (phosphoserine phosphatase)
MNNELSENNDTNMFVTMFIGLLHIDSGKLDFCNCGHNAPVLDGKFMDIKHANLPLGLFKGFAFESESIADIRDKMMFIYTDGLNEAENPAKELFGDDAILKELSGTDKLTSREVIDKIIAAVENHRQGEDPNDDMTLMCFKLSKTA